MEAVKPDRNKGSINRGRRGWILFLNTLQKKDEMVDRLNEEFFKNKKNYEDISFSKIFQENPPRKGNAESNYSIPIRPVETKKKVDSPITFAYIYKVNPYQYHLARNFLEKLNLA